MKGFVVALSGGQDSTTALYWALQNLEGPCYAVSFDYGQRHAIELESAKKIARAAHVTHEIIPVPQLSQLAPSALTDKARRIVEVANGLPTSFVPGRNLVFLTFAAIRAYELGYQQIVTGVCQTDYSGYPDCRHNTIQSLALALSLGLDRQIIIHTPLMWLTKAETVTLAQGLGCLPRLADTHTCYHGKRPACGKCPACVIRLRGFREAGIPDPLPYEEDTDAS